MKIYKYITSVAILSFCFLSACNKPTETKIPVPVIFDTDAVSYTHLTLPTNSRV